MLSTLDVSSLNFDQKRLLVDVLGSNSFFVVPTKSASIYCVQSKGERSNSANIPKDPSISHSFIQEPSADCNKSMYEEILKPFTPKVRPITKSPEKYQGFLQHFRNQYGVRAKRLDKHSLITIIESIYSARFADEQNSFKKPSEKGNKNESSFPQFVIKYIEGKWKSLRTSSQVFE